MTITNFPTGFEYGINVRNLPILNTYNGVVYWVDSTMGQDTGQGTYDAPFKTLSYAATRVSTGDKIFLKSGFTETLTSAGAVTLDTIGVAVVGLGEGFNRPRLTMATSTAASVVVSADGVSMINIVGATSIDGNLNPFNVSGDNFWFDGEWNDASTTVETTQVMLISGNKYNIRLKHVGFSGGSGNTRVVGLNGADHGNIELDVYGNIGTAVVEFITAASTDVNISGVLSTVGTTDQSKIVVDTITGSNWYFSGIDMAAGGAVSGSSADPIVPDDAGAIATAVAAIQADIGNPTARTNLQSLEAMLANPDDATAGLFPAIMGNGTYDAIKGFFVTRAAADIIDGSQVALFTISGGRVLITHLSMITSGASIAAGTCNVNFVSNPTSGTDAQLCGIKDVDGDEVGSIYSISGTTAALVGGSAGGAEDMTQGYIAQTGTIDIVSSSDGGSGGALAAVLIAYKPLDAGATVVST